MSFAPRLDNLPATTRTLPCVACFNDSNLLSEAAAAVALAPPVATSSTATSPQP